VEGLWTAYLVSSSPRYSKWNHILGGDEVPLKSPQVYSASLNAFTAEVYDLDLKRLTSEQHGRLVEWIAYQFSLPAEDVARDLAGEGFPIRAEDVAVAFSLRAFI
jgi:hypothetical protein